MQWTKKELVALWMNGEKRKEFVKNYKEWGVWLTVPELGLTYYRYDLPDGARILAMEYTRINPYPVSGDGELQTITIYYLWEGEHFIPSSASEYFIADQLKNLKVTLQNELRAEQAVFEDKH